MTTQRLRTVVTLGGAVDRSLGQMTQQFAQETRRMGRETGTLSRQQQRLETRIRRAVLAGRDVGQMTREYQRLSRRIREASNETDRLRDLSERGARASERLSRSFSQSGAGLGGAGLATAGFAAAMTMTNQATSEMEGIAAGYDMTVETYALWDGIAKRMGDGFDGTKIGDHLEELSNKFGEFKNLGTESAFDEVAKSLSLDTDKMKGMETYDQYLYVMEKLSKVSDKQQAATLADKLFGGDGNRVVMWLKNSGMSLQELLDRQKKMNLLTDKGREGAKKYNDAWVSATSTFGSAWKEVSGIVGGEVAPMLEGVAADFAAWFRDDANKTKLVNSLKEVGRQLRDVGGVIVDVAVVTNNVAQAFGGWGNVAAGVAAFMGGKLVYSIGAAAASMVSMVGGFGAVATFARTAMVAMRGFSLAAMATPLGIFAVLGTLAYTVWENWDYVSDKLMGAWATLKDMWQSITGMFSDTETSHKIIEERQQKNTANPFQTNTFDHSGPSFLAAERINAAAPNAGQSVSNNIGEIKVYTREGQNPEEFGKAIYEQFTSQKFHDFAEAY